MNQIILHGMSKSFGKKNVIKAQNACFSPGQIYGIVGQNGCGKTVLFKCMSGLMPTTSGRIEIQLDDPAQKARPYCGVVIDGAGFNDSLSGLSNLVALADITKKADKKAIASLMTSVGLSPDNRKKVRYYSLGMRQRLATGLRRRKNGLRHPQGAKGEGENHPRRQPPRGGHPPALRRGVLAQGWHSGAD